MHGEAVCLCFCKVVLLALNLSAGHIFGKTAALMVMSFVWELL